MAQPSYPMAESLQHMAHPFCPMAQPVPSAQPFIHYGRAFTSHGPSRVPQGALWPEPFAPCLWFGPYGWTITAIAEVWDIGVRPYAYSGHI